MIEPWILSKLDPLRPAPLIIVRDPQRLIQAGARAVHGWAEENGFTVLFCAGNMALREMYEAMRDEPGAHVLLVDRSREEAKIPLFYPDLAVTAGTARQLRLSLRDYLVEATTDPNWPALVEERKLSRLVVSNLPGVLEAHRQLREASGGNRFSDTDLYRIVLGAALRINPFKKLAPAEIRRLCVQQHRVIDELKSLLPADVMSTLQGMIANAPRPFCWLLDRDPVLVLRAFTLSAIMHQHGLEYQLLLSNIDAELRDYRDISPEFLDQAMGDQVLADPEQVAADVADAEQYLVSQPERLAFLLHERLNLGDPERALDVLRRERLSPLIRSLALLSLLLDLIEGKRLKFHGQVLSLLDQQANEPGLPALRRPTEQWQALEKAYRRTHVLFQLTARLVERAKKLQVAATEDLEFAPFDRLWNEDRLNRLDFYTSDLDRMLRVGDVLPIPHKVFWPELAARWDKVRAMLSESIDAVAQVLALINTRFQDLYVHNYANWIRKPDGPVVFTHQFLPRLLRTHWDPKSGRKAIIMVFDGLRTDAWDELLRPVFEERYQVIATRPGSALIPTETQLSRKAIAAGRLPVEFGATTRELDLLRAWLKQHMQVAPQFSVVVDSDTIASGMSVRYVSDQVEYIVFNFTDENLHHNEQDLSFIYNTTVREIIRQDVRSVLRELPNDALIFVTSDHGFTPMPKRSLLIPGSIVADNGDVKYLNARTRLELPGEDAKHVVDLDPQALGIPGASLKSRDLTVKHILFPRPGYTLRRDEGHRAPDRYSHGGISLAECMVPMVVLGPRSEAQPALAIDAVKQAGAMSEGEPLTLEISLIPMQIGLPDIAITISFSRDEIPVRREVFSGKPTTYAVQWTPRLGEITEEDRKRGAVVQTVTAIVAYRYEGKEVRVTRSVDVQIKLDPTRLRRRIDSKLDLLMGKTPKSLQE